jgi:putative ABC transport system permease protein
MTLLSRFRSWLRDAMRRSRSESEMDAELRFHLDSRAQHFIQQGIAPDEAARRARLEFGALQSTREECRESRRANILESLIQDLRFAARMFRRNPGFTAIAVLTLALGIGANVAIFSVVSAVLLKPLPFPHPEQLVRVYDDLAGSNSPDVGMSAPELWDLRDRAGIFSGISPDGGGAVNLTGGLHPEHIQIMTVSVSYFSLLGVGPEIGRVFTSADEVPGFSDPVVISNAFWHRQFGGDPKVIGRKIGIDIDLYTIVGVMPAGFHHPGRAQAIDNVDIWNTAGFAGAPFPVPPVRSNRLNSGAVARLKPGLTLAQAQSQLDALVAQLQREYPGDYPAALRWRVRLVPMQQALVGEVRTELLVIFGAVGFVLLIACVNLANLLLARGSARRREIGIRLAIGAGRRRLIAQLLTESILLSFFAGAAALVTIFLLKNSLVRLAPAALPRMSEVSLSPGVLAFAFILSIATGVVFGLVPALQSTRASHWTALREGASGAGASKRHHRLSRALVASEIALSLVLLIGAGLLLRSFQRIVNVPLGFEPRQLLTAKFWIPFTNDPKLDRYVTNEKRNAFFQEVLRRVSALPGVQDAALGNAFSLPMDDDHYPAPFTIENRLADLDHPPAADVTTVSTGYFRVLKTPLIAGRVFTDSDDAKSPFVVIVDETFARRYWPDSPASAIGKRVQLHIGVLANGAAAPDPWQTIVGIVSDIKFGGVEASHVPHIFRALLQRPHYGEVIYLRAAADPGALGEAVRREILSMDPNIPVFKVRTMEGVVSEFLAERRFALELLAIFAGVALLLAAIGIYGVMAYTFSRRTNEIGIRIALGASRADILRLALGEGIATILLGLAAGLAGSLLLTRFIQSMLFSVKPTDPVTFVTIAALLAAATLLACLVPAHRASRVEPTQALRSE